MIATILQWINLSFLTSLAWWDVQLWKLSDNSWKSYATSKAKSTTSHLEAGSQHPWLEPSTPNHTSPWTALRSFRIISGLVFDPTLHMSLKVRCFKRQNPIVYREYSFCHPYEETIGFGNVAFLTLARSLTAGSAVVMTTAFPPPDQVGEVEVIVSAQSLMDFRLAARQNPCWSVPPCLRPSFWWLLPLDLTWIAM